MEAIKFRAWDKDPKRMQWPIQIWNDINGMGGQGIHSTYEDGVNTFYETCPPNPGVIEDYVLMQFTGLLDKNGTEIYESDILADSHGNKGIVHWYPGSVNFGLKSVDPEGLEPCKIKQDFDLFGVRELEVIGNAYEHSELLT